MTRYLMRLYIVGLVLVHALFSSGCSTTNDTVEVEVPVPVACVDAIPVWPDINTEANLLAMNRRARTLTVWDERLTLKEHAELLRTMLIACKGGA